MRTLMAAVLAAGLASAAAADEKDLTAGKWVIESVTRDGKADDGLKGATRVYDGGKYTISLYGVGIDVNAVGEPAAGKVWLQGSSTLPVDGKYSIDGADFRSLPAVGAWLSIGG